MSPARLEAFSDGVLAIVLTIMVLEIVPPEGHKLTDWYQLLPIVVAYVFSFIVIAIYWNNHHNLLKATKKVTPAIMWANMHLLFWLSLIPATTAWLGEHGNFNHQGPVALYAGVGFFAGLAYYILSRSIIATNPKSQIAKQIGKDKKGLFSQFIYFVAIILTFISPVAALVTIWATAVLWVIPDRRLVHTEE